MTIVPKTSTDRMTEFLNFLKTMRINEMKQQPTPYVLDIEIEGIPKMITNMKSNGWRAIHFEKAKWKKLVAFAVKLAMRPDEPIEKAKITLTRYSSRESDFDNRVASFKSVVDGLVNIGVLKDDKDSVIVEREYPWVKVSPKDSKIRIRVEEIL